tara:strand:+ start:2280 stop:2450 length:171 start_codon:yes stop_codon:yes gene_type:complete
VSNKKYRKRFDEIFNQAKEFVYGEEKLYGQKENEELAESYKESRRQQKERDGKRKN